MLDFFFSKTHKRHNINRHKQNKALQYVRTYLDDSLVITKGSFEDDLQQVEVVLETLKEAEIRCNAPKCGFALLKIEYVG